MASPKAPCGTVHFAASTECWHNRLARQMTAVRQPVSVPSGTGPHRKAVSCICFEMADRNPELERLLKAERLAFNRYDGLRGYPGDVQEIALDLWTEAQEAVRAYRAKHP
jgi:hypothetical protein